MSIPDLPNVEDWLPRESQSETLRSALLNRCLAVERMIRVRSDEERKMNLDNFDSGAGVEDILREELKRILPTRYEIDRGVVLDRDGRTSGDHDVVIFNDLWFPRVKAGATLESRRTYFPIEGVYALGEVKQSLSYDSFDKAMRKLVIAHRLKRPPTFAKKLVENRESSSCSHGLSNPLYSFVLALNLADGLTFEEIINRFYDINRKLKRDEVVRCLCVLGQGVVVWGFEDPDKLEIKPALFMLNDLYEPLIPMYMSLDNSESPLYGLLCNLLLHLFHSVLAPEDIAANYGPSLWTVKTPKSADVRLQPDPERFESLKHPCAEDHER